MDFEPLRWVTIHPALVHLPLGVLPLAVLAYVVGASLRSREWTFAGDVALVVGALGTAAAGVFGIVSWLVLPWPGGLDPWRWVHLGTGVASVTLVLIAVVVRLARRRTRPVVEGVFAGAVTAIAALALFTGWVGGEVLVFHGGMAVKAAGSGALAPAMTSREVTPASLLSSMAHIRGSWAAANATFASAIVERPRPETFETIARDAQRLQSLGQWVMERGAKEVKDADEAEDIREMAGDFIGHARDLENAARTQDIAVVAERLGTLQADCAACHEHTRWEEGERAQHAPHVATAQGAHR